MTTSQQPSLPVDLQAKLNAAGVTDNASLQAALARDPDLRAEFNAWLMQSLLAGFDAVQDPDALFEFWREVPSGREQSFIQTVEAIIASGQLNDSQGEKWRAKLADFKRICDEAARQRRPLSPLAQALVEFLRAEDEATARKVFEQRRTLLQPYEAQRLLEAQRTDDAETQLRISARIVLLRQLRGAAPQPTQAPSQDLSGLSTPSAGAAFDNRQMQVAGNLLQAQHININNVFDLKWRFIRPAPPTLTKELVSRADEIDAVFKKLEAQGTVAISGKTAPNALTMQGMAGVGKTSLALLLAHRLDADYRDGVLWTDIGPGVQKREDAGVILKTWASHYVGGIADKALDFTPEAVRALMAEHPRLLVIFDNVWSLDAIQPLREALPPEAHQIITTRSLEIMRHAGGATHQVGLLSQDDALALLALRAEWQPAKGSPDAVWVDELIARLGRHPLALDIAFSAMREEGFGPTDWRATAERLIQQVKLGQDFGDMKLSTDIDRETNVETSLAYGYNRLDAAAQARFRQLGAFASEADFTTALAASVWQCDETAARAQLALFVQRALLDRRGDGLWRQHAILRGYALALLHREGAHEGVAARHADAIDAAMRAADDAQRYHQMLPAYDQLAHAFAWAIENDLDRALNLIGNCANLQAQFGKVRDNLNWSQQALGMAQLRGQPAELARAQGTLANALARAATLPGEDRRARLLQALDAYDKALEFRRPDTAPLDYAMTQNNRATLLSDIATLPGEDRRARLLQALDAYDKALEFRRPDTAPLDYAMTQNNRATLLSDIATLPGEDRRARMVEALRVAVEAVLLFEQYQQAQYLEVGKRVLRSLRDACGDDLAEFWASAGLGAVPIGLEESDPASNPIQAALNEYFTSREAAEKTEQNSGAWQRAADAGEGLLSMLGTVAIVPEQRNAIQADIADTYNMLGSALDETDKPQALAAYERAIALQPDFAMWHRNRAGTLIELGRLDEAEVAIARARALEPDAPRLVVLDSELAEARGAASPASDEGTTP